MWELKLNSTYYPTDTQAQKFLGSEHNLWVEEVTLERWEESRGCGQLASFISCSLHGIRNLKCVWQTNINNFSRSISLWTKERQCIVFCILSTSTGLQWHLNLLLAFPLAPLNTFTSEMLSHGWFNTALKHTSQETILRVRTKQTQIILVYCRS